MTLVVDASVVVAAVSNRGATGEWALRLPLLDDLAAPHLMPAEAANILRLAAGRGDISSDSASLAHDDLLAFPVRLFPYAPLAARIWELRFSLTSYDAWYVALAEELGVRLATLDARLVRSSGPRCDFLTPP